MKKLLITFSLAVLGISAAAAGPVEDREAIMKERAGLLRQLSPMAKGEAAFDAAAAGDLLAKLDANAKKGSVEELFPEGSQAGTEASPAIWEDMNGFKAAWAKYADDTSAAVAANPQDQASLQAAFGTVSANCGSCHQLYRVKK